MLDIILPLEVEPLGVGINPGPSHMSDGVMATPDGREMVQVRVTVSPATMEEEGEETRDMLAGSVEKRKPR